MQLIPIAIAVLTSLSMVYADTGFKTKCTSISTKGSMLTATCFVNDGQYPMVTSTLDLNECYVNGGGRLYCQQNGGFSSTCKILEGSNNSPGSTLFWVQCKTSYGFYSDWATDVDLNDCIGVQDGNLHCF